MSATTTLSRWIGTCAVATMVSTTALAQHDHPIPTYLMSELGTLADGDSVAVGMNDLGVVVGWAEKAGFETEKSRHAFLWSQPSGMVDFGTLGGAWSDARDVNNEGVVVGSSETATGASHGYVAWLQRDTVIMWDLNKLVPTGKPRGDIGNQVKLKELTEAIAINDAGVIVACGTTWTSEQVHGFMLKPLIGCSLPEFTSSPHPGMFELVDLGRLPGAEDCLPTSINENDAIVGISGQRAFFWEGSMSEMNGFKGDRAGNDINEGYVAVGSYKEGRIGPKPCKWYCSRIAVPLDNRVNPVGEAFAINDSMNTVGWSAKAMGDDKVATLWDSHNYQIDLNMITVPSPISPVKFERLVEAVSIDARGRIAVNGVTVDGKMQAVLLTPSKPGIPALVAE